MARLYSLSIMILLIFCGPVHGQLLKKLKKKAEQAVERTLLKKTDEVVANKTEQAIDAVVNPPSVKISSDSTVTASTTYPDGMEFQNPALEHNTDAKWEWYTSDLRVTSYDKDKQSDMVIYFDADAVAMQSYYTDQNSGNPITSFIDSDGYFISYSDSEGQYTKSALLSMGGMNMIAPSMMATAYKIPESAIFSAMEMMQEKKLAVYPFMHIDFAFVLKPEHFKDDMISDRYKESKQSCRGKMGCTKFSVTEQGYVGSYTLFDAQNRLVEINIEVENDPFYGSGKGKIAYFYEDCEVKLPKAVEKKIPGQDLLQKGMNINKN